MTDPTIRDLCGAVDQDALMAHMREFARRVKLSGTPEELESFRYLQAALDATGFRTTLLSHDAYISLPGPARVTVDGDDLACITHSFSRPSPDGGARGTLAHVGAGRAEDFAGRDLAGRVALVDGMARPEISLRASQAGCLGQLHISPREHPHEMCISPVWGSPTDQTRALLPRTVVCSLPHAAGERLRARAAAGEAVEVTLHAEVDTGWRKTPVLVAELAAPDAGAGAGSAGARDGGPDGGPDGGDDAPFVLFSGHHDTWYYGVMDNGGANATMLEVAKVLAGRRAEWRRGLRLCFWSGHSHGRYSGSSWYADAFWDDLERRCVAHVNVDSTGARGNTAMENAPVSAELRALGREAVREQGGQALGDQRMVRAGDQSFWGVGVPSMFMSLGSHTDGTGLGWWWHTPEDLLDKIEPEMLVRDTRVYVHTLWRLLTDAVLPLDYGQHARDLLAVLDGLAGDLGPRFDLAPLASRARALAEASAALQAASARDPDAANRALVAASRALVPADYTDGDRFEPDPALAQSAWPSLDPLRRLAAVPDGSDEARFLTVAATRGRNRLAHALDRALAALRPTPA